MSEPKSRVKSHDIPKRLVWGAWLKVKGTEERPGSMGCRLPSSR